MALDTAPGVGARDNGFARRLFSPLPERYDRLAEWLSLGQNRRWRAAMVERLAEGSPALVLDVATGTAGVALAVAARTGARVVGVDVSEDMVRTGRRRVEAAGRGGAVALVLGRGEQLPLPDASVDAVSFTYLLRYVADPAATLAELARVVRPGGVVANLEFCVPRSAFWRAWWWGYTRLVLPLAGAVTGGRGWFAVGRFLGPNISAHYRRYPLDWTVQAWRDAGLKDVGVRRMSLGGGVVMWGRRGGA
ncbi:MAG TPA: class I SAM-dependent methyltransferase [Acidimicrobiales bacterium]|nr:class I SAM-dependent methyltransferase [Acidimicrobiales bacterium]